ncbi:MAG TPA: DUF3617 family protein [Hyphomonadaceae bacterium]|nr:DUF3617 family protein [Hyphomonadaceae bacterium]
MRLAIAAAAAALGLAACGQSEPAADSASTAAPAADGAAPAPAAPAPAAMPATVEGPAAGKWRMTITAMGQTMPPTETCYAKQVSLEEAEKMQQSAGITCSEQSYRKEGDAWIGHSVCSMPGAGTPMKVTQDSRVAGDFSSKYTIDITSKMDPPPMPSMAEQKITITAERIGDC